MATTSSTAEYREALKAWQARLASWAGLDLATTTTVDAIEGGMDDFTQLAWTAHCHARPAARRGIPCGETYSNSGDPRELPEWRCVVRLMPGETAAMWEEVGAKPVQFIPEDQTPLEMHPASPVADLKQGDTVRLYRDGEVHDIWVGKVEEPSPDTFRITPEGYVQPSLTEFLLARVTERESLARDMQHQAAAGRPFIDPATLAGGTLIRELIDPDRLRVECETKRQIIKGEQRSRAKQDAPEHGRGWDGFEEFISLPNGAEIRGDALDAFITAWYEPSPPSRVLRLLALPHADHPDYDQEWRP